MADVSGITAAVPPAQSSGGFAAINPLQAIGTLSEVANRQVLNKLYQQDIINRQLEAQQVDQAMKLKMGGVAAGLGMALALDPNASPDKARTLIGHFESLYGQSPALDMLKDHVSDGMSGSQVRELGRTIAYANTTPEVQQRMASPHIDWIDQGGQIKPMATYSPGSMGGQEPGVPQPAGAALPTSMTPAQRAQRVPGPVNQLTGQTTEVPLESVTPSDIPGGKAGPGGTGAVVTGLPPSFEDSRKMGQALTSRAENVAANKGNYQALLSDLEAINTGPAADRQLHAAAFLQKWGSSSLAHLLTGLTPDQIARGEGFGKIASQIALAQAQTIGSTDTTQANAMSANPNLSLSTPGNTQIIHKLLGNEDAIDAKRNAWNAWSAKYGQGSYNLFSQWWNKNVDVRAFQVPYMQPGSDEAKGTLSFQGNKAAAAEYIRRHDITDNAIKNGWGSVFTAPTAQDAAR